MVRLINECLYICLPLNALHISPHSPSSFAKHPKHKAALVLSSSCRKLWWHPLPRLWFGKHQFNQTKAVLFWKDMVCLVHQGLAYHHFDCCFHSFPRALTVTFCWFCMANKKRICMETWPCAKQLTHNHALTLLLCGQLMTSLPLPTELFTPAPLSFPAYTSKDEYAQNYFFKKKATIQQKQPK